MTEIDLQQRFGVLVKRPYLPFDPDAIEDCLIGIKRQIENEPFPERRKQLRRIRTDLQILLKYFL